MISQRNHYLPPLVNRHKVNTTTTTASKVYIQNAINAKSMRRRHSDIWKQTLSSSLSSSRNLPPLHNHLLKIVPHLNTNTPILQTTSFPTSSLSSLDAIRNNIKENIQPVIDNGTTSSRNTKRQSVKNDIPIQQQPSTKVRIHNLPVPSIVVQDKQNSKYVNSQNRVKTCRIFSVRENFGFVSHMINPNLVNHLKIMVHKQGFYVHEYYVFRLRCLKFMHSFKK